MDSVYVAIIKDPEYRYSGEPEAWRENVELLFRLGYGRIEMMTVVHMTDDPGRNGKQVDWATWIAEVTLAELRDWLMPKHQIDVTASRPYFPGASDDEIRERMKLDQTSQVAQLEEGPRYALVAVEGI